MKILVLNCGSSSLKYQVFDMNKKISIQKWNIEKIVDYKKAIQEVIKNLNTKIGAIWHRVVHGWEEFSQPTIINNKVIKQIESCIPLAPLHNPANITGIKICKKLMPNVPQVAIFDTAFYQSMNIENFLYPIPYKYYEKDKVRKYGFHGTSHDYVTHKACKNLWKKYATQNIISCHIWNWASITAIKKWRIFKTSMWMTPLDGVMMWTRSGSIDPSIVWYLHKQEHLDIAQVEEILNKKSWLLWVSEKSGDMREILKWIEQWNEKCKIAYNMFINRIIKYIWAYMTLMWWVDLIVFTAWILENRPSIRKDIIKRLKFMGAKIDDKNNKAIWEMKVISTKDSTITVMLVPTNEEYMIAKHTYKLIKE